MRRLLLIFIMAIAMGTSLAIHGASRVNEVVGLKLLPLPDNRVRVIFQFREKLALKPASFLMKKPAKLVFDFIGVKDGVPPDDYSEAVNIGVLKKYTIIEAKGRTRVVLDLSSVVAYSTDRVGKRFNVTLSGVAKRKLHHERESFYSTKNVSTRHQIKDIDFRGTGESGGGKLVVALSSPNMNVDVSQAEQQVTVKFLDTRIPRKLLRRLDVVDFKTPATMVDTFQRSKNAQIKLKMKGNYGHFAYQVNRKFIVEVFPLTAEEVATEKQKKQVFTGKRLSLNFQDIKVRAVIQILAEFTKKNMVVSDAVNGNITLRLNNIPWDQALNIILKTRGLVERKMGSVLLIAPASEVAAREKQEADVQAQATILEPLISDTIQLNYAKTDDIINLLSGSKGSSKSRISKRGSLSADPRTNTLWIQDTAVKIGEIKEIIHQLDVPVKQVLIEARIVIVNKDFERDIGVRFGISNRTHLSGTLAGANQIAGGTAPSGVSPVSQRLNLDLAAPVTTGTPASIGLALAELGNGILLDLELSALESEGRGEVISSPRLITANQQSAVIEAGEEIPYQEASSSGATTTAFKKAVLRLKVTPQITPDHKVILDLQVNQDTPSTQRFNGVPGILTKQIETNVLVNNGQTIVLGGIYRQDKKQAINRVPFLGYIPLVGALFRNRQDIVKHEELLIFITPKIITNAFATS